MSVLPFPSPQPQSVEDVVRAFAHLSATEQADALHRHVAAALERMARDLGAPSEWVASAVAHLKEQAGGQSDGGVTVSRASLHLALGYIELLETRLGIIAASGGAA